MKTTILHISRLNIRAISLILSFFTCCCLQAAIGVIDLDIKEAASDVFELYYHDGNELILTDYDGFKNERYPLTTSGEYLITDSISLLNQKNAGVSFTFNGQGMQTMRLDLLDMDNNVIWSFYDEDLYSGTKASSAGKVPYKTVRCDDISINIKDGALPALAKLRISAVSGQATYRMHLHALNLYSTPDAWDQCRIELAAPVKTDGSKLYLTWISLNGASGYDVVVEPDTALEPFSIAVAAVKHATHHVAIPLDGLRSFTYHIEARMGDHTVKSESWRHTPVSGLGLTDAECSEVRGIPSGIRAVSGIDGNVTVYTITGTQIAAWHAKAAEVHDVMVPAGIYMVRFPDRTIKAIAGL